MTAPKDQLVQALAEAGEDVELRSSIFDLLREAEKRSADRLKFRGSVRAPIISALLETAGTHTVELSSGLKFEVSPVSRIELALLLSSEGRPDHVWEPQTTRLLTMLAEKARHVIVGGAYIGDQVLPIAQVAERVHAFEPMREAYERLLGNIALNGIGNVTAHRAGLWDESGLKLDLSGDMALASSSTSANGEVQSLTIDDYAREESLSSVDLIMLDTEGGEERALHGAAGVLASHKPHVVFEVHRNFVDWSNGLDNTPVMKFLTSLGYSCFAIRDYHDNVAMAGSPIELIPIAEVYLQGPPHGFNVLATRADVAAYADLRMVKDVSPKLLFGRDPALHAPLS